MSSFQPIPWVAVSDDDGAPLAGGKLYTFASGTTTPKATFSDSALITPNTNPILLNARGECQLVLGPGAYTLKLLRWDDTLVKTIDGVANESSALTVLLGGLTGAASVGGASQTVPSISALRSLLKTSASKNAYVAGYYAPGDGGGGSYYLDATDTISADNGVTLIVANDAGRWRLSSQDELSIKQAGAKGDWVTDDAAKFQFMATNAENRGWVIPEGQYVIKSAVNFDYSDPAYVTAGVRSSRASIRGASMANTIINYDGPADSFCFNLIGAPAGLAGQGIYSMDTFSNFSFQSLSRTPSKNAFLLRRKQMFKLQDIHVEWASVGLRVESCYTGEFENVIVRNSVFGMVFFNSGDGSPNAIRMKGVVTNSCSKWGQLWLGMGTDNTLSNCVIETCGTFGDADSGGIHLISDAGGGGPIVLNSVHFEQNRGLADLFIENTSGIELVVTLTGCMFLRAFASNYVTNNIIIRNTGAGSKTKIILKACHFLSIAGYPPSSARPFINPDAQTEIIDEGCVYSETTSLTHKASSGRVMGGAINSDGSVISAPPQISIIKTGTGQYKVRHSSAFGATMNHFYPVAISNDSTGGVKVERIAVSLVNEFIVVTSNTAGTLTDCPFTFLVMLAN